jgi:hypothetical protein
MSPEARAARRLLRYGNASQTTKDEDMPINPFAISLRRSLPVSFAIVVTLLMGSADAWAKGNEAAAPPPITAPSTKVVEPEELQVARDLATAAGLSFDDLYAQREQAAEALGLFQGGDVVIISSTAVIIILLVILILVLA